MEEGILRIFLLRLRKLAFLLMHPNYLLRFIKLGSVPAVEHYNSLRKLNLSTVVDVGAHRGQFASICEFMKVQYIYSFEPQREEFKKLKSLRIKNLIAKQTAVGNRSGTIKLNVSKATDSSSVLEPSKLQTQVFPSSSLTGTEVVSIEKLDILLDTTLNHSADALLKIDVQGLELEVLAGAKNIISRCRYLLIECSFQTLYIGQTDFVDIHVLLNGMGFRIKQIYNIDNDKLGQIMQADVLFEKCA